MCSYLVKLRLIWPAVPEVGAGLWDSLRKFWEIAGVEIFGKSWEGRDSLRIKKDLLGKYG